MLTSAVHYFPVLGVYIRVYASTEGVGDFTQARRLNQTVCKQLDDDGWQNPFVHATVVAWWITEYSGWYVDEHVEAPLNEIDLDKGNSPSDYYL